MVKTKVFYIEQKLKDVFCVLIKNTNEISSFAYLAFKSIGFVVKRADITDIDLETPTAWTYMKPSQDMETVDPWDQVTPCPADLNL
jgi:hypothetical protein